MSHPRKFTDDELVTTYRVLSSCHGRGVCTIRAIGAVLGVSGPAIIRRMQMCKLPRGCTRPKRAVHKPTYASAYRGNRRALAVADIDTLSECELRVLRCRRALESCTTRTASLAAIARVLGVTRQAVEQAEDRIAAKPS